MSYKRPFHTLYNIDADTGCWIWTGSRGASGHTIYWDSSHNNYVSARRWLYDSTHDTPLVPSQRMVSTCGQKHCVCPDHTQIRTEYFKNPNYTPRGPRPNSRGPRPQVWLTGPDPVLHQKYRVWLQQKNQAQWRGEVWNLAFDHWVLMWGELWHNRGRGRGDYCMTRRDHDAAWDTSNAHVVTRSQHAQQQSAQAHAGYRSPAQARRRLKLGLDTL